MKRRRRSGFTLVERRRRSGFTLVELMITLGVIGVLVAIAIPNFLRYQLRARASEAVTHIKAIAATENAYFSEFGTYVSVSTPVPATLPGAVRVPWPGSSGFDTIGWAPEGSVQFQYRVGADAAGGPGPLRRFTVESAGDLDDDGTSSFFAYMKPAGGAGALAGALSGTTCAATGVYGPGSGGPVVLNSPGPCDSDSGRSRF